ncbi:MAG: metallophosphoesterase [Lachnospiraceae bacterium]|nr:metallophosphoesterase [Lachnospiraceae bacterium]
MFFLIFAGIFLLVAVVLLGYVATRVNKFYIVKKWVGESKGKRRFCMLLPILVVFIFGYLDFVNTVIVVLHLGIFCLFFELVQKVVQKVTGKESGYYVAGIVAIMSLAVYLTIGWYNAHHVWETHYQMVTSKDIGDKPCRIVGIADSHVGTTFDGEGFAKHMQEIEKTNPDVLVVAGDFVDDSTTKADMIRSCEALGEIKTTYGVYLCWGNHDEGYFDGREFDFDELKAELQKNRVEILEDEAKLIDNRFYIIGREDYSYRERKSMEELTKGLDTSKYMFVLDHQPHDFLAEAKAGVDMVLCGHTHGGQMFPIGITGELSGANEKTYGLETRKDTNFIVTSGISDWAIKFKTATFSEYVVIDITKE